jgi:hypothetical protein
MSCTSSAANAYGSVAAKSSLQTGPVGPGVITPVRKPVITGKSSVGKKLKASAGTWSPAPTSFTYQWQKLSRGKYVDLRGATARTYKVKPAEKNKYLRVIVTVVRPGYKGTAASARVRI